MSKTFPTGPSQRMYKPAARTCMAYTFLVLVLMNLIAVLWFYSDWVWNGMTPIVTNHRIENCMSAKFASTKGSSLDEGKIEKCNLCSVYNGRIRSNQCEYKHPDIVNYVKFTNASSTNLSFEEFVSIISVDRFYKPDKIVIFSNTLNFSGFYWDKLQNISTPLQIRLTHRFKSIGKQKKKTPYVTHEADYLKVSTCYKEGGIYMDFDAVILNGMKLREMQKKSELVIGRDDGACQRTCAGLFSCVPNSPFVKKWLDSYETHYQPSSWLYNAGTVFIYNTWDL